MDVGVAEVLIGGVGGILSILGGLYLKSQQQMVGLMNKLIDSEKPDPGTGNGNGVNHTKTHMLLEQVVGGINDNHQEFRDINTELKELNRNLRGRPCIYDK